MNTFRWRVMTYKLRLIINLQNTTKIQVFSLNGIHKSE